MVFEGLLPGTTAGLAIGGAWLTAIGFMRLDKDIRLEEATYADGGHTRIVMYQEAARVGRLGLAFTSAAIILPLFVTLPPHPPLAESSSVALGVVLGVRVVS